MVDTVWHRIDSELQRRKDVRQTPSSWADLGRQIGATRQRLTNWKTRGVPPKDYPAIADAFGWSVDQLLGTAANPLKEPNMQFKLDNVELGPETKGLVPLISWVQAGAWAESCDVLELHEVEKWLECPAPHSKCTAALRVRGDSMTAPIGAAKTYPEGVIIYVDFEKKSPVNGQRIVAKIDGGEEVTFKVFKQEDGRTWLQPLNPMHEPIRDEFKVLGTVIGTWIEE